jgi:hypothetical protein
MKPATRKSESSIIKNYDPHDPVRLEHTYGSLKGGEIIEAVNRYHGKVNMTVAEQKIAQIAQSQAKSKAKKLEIELEVRGGIPQEIRGEEMKTKIENIRAKQAESQKERIKKEQAEAKKRLNIARTKATESKVEDMPID